MKHKLAAKGIIRRGDGKILIVKRSAEDDHQPGMWETAGGAVEKGASPQAALTREIREETGLEVEVGEPFNVFTFAKANGDKKIGITFICDYLSGEVKLSEEHSDWRWIDPFDFKKFDSIQPLYNEISGYANKFSGEHERFVISQKGIFIRDKKCLILEVDKKPDVWDLPGGRINNNENGQESFRREIKEELGVDNFEVSGVIDYEAWHTRAGFAVCGAVNLIEIEGEIKISNEHTKLKWINEGEIDQHEFVWPAMSRMIKNGFRRAKAMGII
ncbi:MAG: NUDIX domain-containing protein [bacterium]|nr:NUDIX domain-containing protein [bacterium]